jgi:hypothetical protein
MKPLKNELTQDPVMLRILKELKEQGKKEIQLRNLTKKEMNIIFAYRNMGEKKKRVCCK